MAKRPIGELQKKLRKRMIDEGWKNITHFSEKSGIAYSMETVRRAINTDDYGKKIEPATLAAIMFHLGVEPKEIKHNLQTYTDDVFLHKIIGDIDYPLSSMEQALVEAFRGVHKVMPNITTHLALLFGMVAEPLKIDISKWVEQLKRKEP